MKIMIDNSSYKRLSSGISVIAECLNDYVSTTRRDINGVVHEYESRQHLMEAFVRASASRVVSVWSRDCMKSIKAVVKSVGHVWGTGLVFEISLCPHYEKAVRK